MAKHKKKLLKQLQKENEALKATLEKLTKKETTKPIVKEAPVLTFNEGDLVLWRSPNESKPMQWIVQKDENGRNYLFNNAESYYPADWNSIVKLPNTPSEKGGSRQPINLTTWNN